MPDNTETATTCWTRLSDLRQLGLLSSDQISILGDQLEVNDGEVIRHLLIETSDKIVQLAGDMLYERNLITNIDGGRGSLMIIERPDDSDPCLTEDIVIETCHSVRRFSVASYSNNRKTNSLEKGEALDTSSAEDTRCDFSLHSSDKGEGQGLVVERRAFRADCYLQRMRSHSQVYTSEDVHATVGAVHTSTAHSVKVPRGSNSPSKSSGVEQGSPRRRQEKRATMHCSAEEAGVELELELEEATTLVRPLLGQTPSLRRIDRSMSTQKNMTKRLTSFEDDTHVTIAIEDDAEVCDNVSNKTTGIFKPLRKTFAKLWGMGKQKSFQDDSGVVEVEVSPSSGGDISPGHSTGLSRGRDEEVEVSYADSYSRGKEGFREDAEFTHQVNSDLSEEEWQQSHAAAFDTVTAAGNKPSPKKSFTVGNFRKIFMGGDAILKKEKNKRNSPSVATSFAMSNTQLAAMNAVSQRGDEEDESKVIFADVPSLTAKKKAEEGGGEADGGDDDDGSVRSVTISQKFQIHRRTKDPLAPKTDLSTQLMESRTIDDYNVLPPGDNGGGDVMAIRVPKRYLSYYVGGRDNGLLKGGGNGKKNLPSHSSIQKSVSHLKSDFLSRKESGARLHLVEKRKSAEDLIRRVEEEASGADTVPPALSPTVLEGGKEKRLRFSTVDMRFFSYCPGSGVPSDGGPSLGLHGSYSPSESLSLDLDIFEDFRGGLLPEDEDELDEDEEWNENWRLPREYFVDRGGHLPVQERCSLLRSCGARKISIDLSSHLSKMTLSSRLMNSRSRAPRLLIEGVDPDEVTLMMEKAEATHKLEPLLIAWTRRWLQHRHPERYSSSR